MDELTIKQQLDTLAEFQEEKIILAADKRKLLEEVKVPEEIQSIIADGNRRISELKDPVVIHDEEFDRQIQAELDAIVIPIEVQDILAEIDRKRDEIREKKTEFYRLKEKEVNLLCSDIARQRLAIQTEVNEKVKATIDSVAQKRAEIEAEFGDKQKAVDENIQKLIDQIKKDTIALGKTVHGQFKMSVYSPGRTTWNTDGLDELIIQGHEELKKFRKVGDPSVSIRDL